MNSYSCDHYKFTNNTLSDAGQWTGAQQFTPGLQIFRPPLGPGVWGELAPQCLRYSRIIDVGPKGTSISF